MHTQPSSPLTAHRRSSFFFAFLFLPTERRRALEAVYAFCRAADDAVDSDEATPQRRRDLDALRALLDDVYAGAPPAGHALATELAAAVARFSIKRVDLDAILDGCAIDLAQARYADFAELERYCYGVASSVGLACIEIFGYTSPSARTYAIELGLALQLTNIVRDVAEDAQRGRIYLPLDELEAFGVRESDLLAGRATAALDRLLRFQVARARLHYLRARAALAEADRGSLVIAEIMGDIYYAILERIEADGFDVFAGRTRISGARKLELALRRFTRTRIERLVA